MIKRYSEFLKKFKPRISKEINIDEVATEEMENDTSENDSLNVY